MVCHCSRVPLGNSGQYLETFNLISKLSLLILVYSMGQRSQKNVHEYLEDFVSEMLELQENGLQVIGIDHDTVCAGVVGTAIRNSTSCAGRCAAACGRAGRHNECCSGLQYQPRQRRPYKWSISILPRSQFYKKQGKLAFSTSCTAVRPDRRLRNDAWWRDS